MHHRPDDEALPGGEGDFKSKSQVKRELKGLQALGKTLIALPVAKLATLVDRTGIAETLHQAIIDAQKMKRSALVRQTQYIGRLLRDENEQAIRQELDRLSRPHNEDVARQHQAEQRRDALIAGDRTVLNELLDSYPGIDRQYLRQLARNAQREREQSRPAKAARQLYQYLYGLDSEQD